jgi:hypothetical protein
MDNCRLMGRTRLRMGVAAHSDRLGRKTHNLSLNQILTLQRRARRSRVKRVNNSMTQIGDHIGRRVIPAERGAPKH